MVTLQCGMIVTSDICCLFIKIALLELEPNFFHYQIFLHPLCASRTEIEENNSQKCCWDVVYQHFW